MKTSGIYFLLSALFLTILFSKCQNKTEKTEDKHPLNCDQIESGTPANVMLTSYSTTVFPGDTTLLRLALTDQLAREITTAKDSIRFLIDEGAVLLNNEKKPFYLEKDTSGMQYVDLWLENGVLKAWFVVTNEHVDKLKIEAQVLNQKEKKIWPGSHEIQVLPSDFENLQPTAEQLAYRTDKKIEKMMGADVSFIPQTEAEGRSFKLKGEEVDPLKLLKESGFNAIRLRIFVNPELENGYSPGKGFCGLDKTLDFAKRVKKEGFKILLDFHYSDYWADPQKQFKPKAWEGLNFDELSQKLEDYTFDIMQQFKSQGTLPDMVQVGNEINHGMVWPEGHISHPDQLAELLKAGIRGVEKTDANIPIMLHIALGGQNVEAVRWYNNMIGRDVKFDVIGLSFYPRWHGTLADLEANINNLIERYHKPVNVVEYNWYKKCVNDIVFNLPEEYQSGTFVWEPLHWQTDMSDFEGNINSDVVELYQDLSNSYLR